MRTRTRITLAGLALGAALVGGVAWATIPADSGLYTACKLKATGTIRLIDPAGRAARSSAAARPTRRRSPGTRRDRKATPARPAPGPKASTARTGSPARTACRATRATPGSGASRRRRRRRPAGARRAGRATGFAGPPGPPGPATRRPHGQRHRAAVSPRRVAVVLRARRSARSDPLRTPGRERTFRSRSPLAMPSTASALRAYAYAEQAIPPGPSAGVVPDRDRSGCCRSTTALPPERRSRNAPSLFAPGTRCLDGLAPASSGLRRPPSTPTHGLRRHSAGRSPASAECEGSAGL